MASLLWGAWSEEWALAEKVSFNGVTKHITVNAGVTALDIGPDVYSAWKRWVMREDNMRFLPAMRATGGDPIPGGTTGSTYFTSNSWRLIYDPSIVAVTGVLYSEVDDTAYWSAAGLPVYPATVSALVNNAVSYQNVVTGTALTPTETADAVWQRVIESGISAEQMTRLMAAILLGKVSGAGTGTEVFRDINDTVNRVTATVDTNGNRTAITVNAA